MIKQRFKDKLSRLLERQQCPELLARSFCVGTYIAFSPFAGLHTCMVFVTSWAFCLEYTVVLAAAWLINNPWTMVPVYAFGYNAGDFFLRTVLGIHPAAYNPHCIQPITKWLAGILGASNLSFWSFIIGGNIVGLCAAVFSYPLMKRFFKRLVHERDMKNKDHTE